MKKLSYGQAVDLCQVLNTQKSVLVFIPQKFPWENDEKTEMVLNNDFCIKATKNSKLLIKTENGIKEIDIPFSDMKHKKSCDLRNLLKEKKIFFQEADGIYCDGTVWTQGESTEKVCYCKKGLISWCCSPCWGNQYEFYFADKKIRPIAGERTIKIIRFSYCKKDAWPQAVDWFLYMIKKKRNIDFSDLYRVGKELNRWRRSVNGCNIYLKGEAGSYDWYDLSSVL